MSSTLFQLINRDISKEGFHHTNIEWNGVKKVIVAYR